MSAILGQGLRIIATIVIFRVGKILAKRALHGLGKSQKEIRRGTFGGFELGRQLLNDTGPTGTGLSLGGGGVGGTTIRLPVTNVPGRKKLRRKFPRRRRFGRFK